MPIDLRMVTEGKLCDDNAFTVVIILHLLEFPPIEYWILTAENQKAELKKLRSDIEAVSINTDTMHAVLSATHKNEHYYN